MDDLAAKALRQSERAYGTMKSIHDDVKDGEFDGARSHIEILRRQLTDLDEKLYVAVTSAAMMG